MVKTNVLELYRNNSYDFKKKNERGILLLVDHKQYHSEKNIYLGQAF